MVRVEERAAWERKNSGNEWERGAPLLESHPSRPVNSLKIRTHRKPLRMTTNLSSKPGQAREKG